MIRLPLLAVSLACLLGAAAPAAAFDVTSTRPVNITAARVALKAYDPVSYHTAGQPLLGRAELTAEHEGAIYHFANPANLELFKADPAKYAPQYGGFCARAAAAAKKYDGDPHVYRIEEGKLLLFSYPAALTSWNEDLVGNAAAAKSNWPKIKDKAPNDL